MRGEGAVEADERVGGGAGKRAFAALDGVGFVVVTRLLLDVEEEGVEFAFADVATAPGFDAFAQRRMGAQQAVLCALVVDEVDVRAVARRADEADAVVLEGEGFFECAGEGVRVAGVLNGAGIRHVFALARECGL